MRNPFVFLATAVSVLLISCPAHAADATRMEVSGGYAFLDDVTVPQHFQGWEVSIAGYIKDWLGVVGEIGYGSGTNISGGETFNLTELSFLGGPKFALRRWTRVTPFAQVLVGGAHTSSGGFVFFSSQGNSFGAPGADFTVQAGGGADLYITSNLGLRLQGDWRRVHASNPTGSLGSTLGGGSTGETDQNRRFVIALVFRK
jgi:opacity protein-like surface antigen